MVNEYLNAKYVFNFGETNFSIEIDDALSTKHVFLKDVDLEKKSLHFHPIHEIFFVFNDGITINFSDKSVEYKNCIIVIPPNQKHLTYRKSDYRILLSCKGNGKNKNGFAKFYLDLVKTNNIFTIPLEDTLINSYLEEINDLFYNSMNAMTKEVIISNLKLLLYKIYLTNASLEKDKKRDDEESRYSIIARIINDATKPGNDVTISTIANAICLSEKQASRIIYKYYQKSLAEVVNDEKLNYATYLLANTQLKISQIAFKCNFHSEEYFYYLFKKNFGVTPLKYRKQQRNN